VEAVTGPTPAIAVATTVAVAAILGIVAGIGRRPQRWHLVLAAVAELAVLGYLVAAVVEWAGGPGPQRPVVFALYVVGALVAIPAAAVWARAEPSRWSPVVVAGACLVAAVLVVRMQQVWAGG
jgi:uncharacterized protein involved in response to NO